MVLLLWAALRLDALAVQVVRKGLEAVAARGVERHGSSIPWFLGNFSTIVTAGPIVPGPGDIPL